MTQPRPDLADYGTDKKQNEMTFHSIVRQWCKTYKPMLDSPENRRFYLADSPDDVQAMPKSIATTFTPCVVMENGVEGTIEGGKVMRIYPVYFFVRAERMVDNDAQMVAYEKAWMHAQNFLTWLRVRHENDPTTTGEYSRINMEDQLYVQPAGPLEDGWVAVMIQFERMEMLNLCEDGELYEELHEDEPGPHKSGR